MEGNVYHGSSKKGLKIISPNKSTHGKPFVYASRNKIIPALFLGRTGGDFTCCLGEDSLGIYVVERFKGAFDLRYDSKSGSIYTLPGNSFSQRKGFWHLESVSESPVIPIEETEIENAADYIRQLAKEGKINFYEYPSRPYVIPKDDSDLVYRAAEWIKMGFSGILEQVKQFHPNLVERVEEASK